MLRRNHLRPVQKLISFTFSRTMSDISSPASTMPQRLKPLVDRNGWSKPDHAQRESFEKLVFYPQGYRTMENDPDGNCTELEIAEYNAACEQLEKLQPNSVFLRNSASNRRDFCFQSTFKYLERSGLSLTAAEQLSVIHVSGTKGKGSTCAMTESILRQYGVRTGFFSSPHLASTNERIRINGEPLAKPKFTRYFWQVYNQLVQKREHENDMPPCFMFLTIFGFHVFVAERVDVLILEVGIGGELDCTNILGNVRTAGITSLALEHTALLGNTLREIAWQKAGIIKPGAHVYTHVTQPECLQVIRDRANERNATLIEVLDTEALFKMNSYSTFLDSLNEFVRLNGALAIQLAYDWLRQTTGPLHRNYAVNETHIADEVLRGLANAHWPGRCQLVEYENMRLFLDGAHTVESIQVCCDWFQRGIKLRPQNPKILVFNRIGDTDITDILNVLQRSCAFDMACFVPNLSILNGNMPRKCETFNCSVEGQRKRATAIAGTWQQMCEARQQPNRGQMYPTVWDAFMAMRTRYSNHIQLDVLITGSMHLLGATVTVLNQFHLDTLPLQPPLSSTTTTNGKN